MVCFTGAPLVVYPLVRLGQRIRRTARRSQEALEHMTHVGTETFAAHRIVKAFGAEEREASRFREALRYLYRTNMRVVRALSVMPPAMELLGGIGMAAALWYGSEQIAAGRLTTGEFTVVPGGAADDVRAGEEAEPRERESPAGDCRGRSHFRDARYAHRGRRVSDGAALAAVCVDDRVPRRDASRTRTPTREPFSGTSPSRCRRGRWSRSSGGAAPARPRSST